MTGVSSLVAFLLLEEETTGALLELDEEVFPIVIVPLLEEEDFDELEVDATVTLLLEELCTGTVDDLLEEDDGCAAEDFGAVEEDGAKDADEDGLGAVDCDRAGVDDLLVTGAAEETGALEGAAELLGSSLLEGSSLSLLSSSSGSPFSSSPLLGSSSITGRRGPAGPLGSLSSPLFSSSGSLGSLLDSESSEMLVEEDVSSSSPEAA